MKFVTIAALALSLTAQSSYASGLAEPLVDPEVIGPEDTMSPEDVAAATTTEGGFLVPLLILAAMVALISSSGGGGGTPPVPPGK